VDDNVDAVESLATLLRLVGKHEVRAAHTGETALKKAVDFQPSVVISDIGLPGMDGYGLVERLRRQPGLERTLMVALSGFGHESLVQRSREAGFDHHLLKPLDLTELEGILAAVEK